MFLTQNQATICHIRLQVQTLKKQGISAAEYYQNMKSLADTMVTVDSFKTDDEIIDLLAGLGPQCSPLAASLTIADKNVTLTNFLCLFGILRSNVGVVNLIW